MLNFSPEQGIPSQCFLLHYQLSSQFVFQLIQTLKIIIQLYTNKCINSFIIIFIGPTKLMKLGFKVAIYMKTSLNLSGKRENLLQFISNVSFKQVSNLCHSFSNHCSFSFHNHIIIIIRLSFLYAGEGLYKYFL